jgi:hypothetical protein
MSWIIVTRTVRDPRYAVLIIYHAWRDVVQTTTFVRVKVHWTRARVEHIGTRSDRYPDAIDIEVEWTDAAVADPRAVVSDPDQKSHTGAIRRVLTGGRFRAHRRRGPDRWRAMGCHGVEDNRRGTAQLPGGRR